MRHLILIPLLAILFAACGNDDDDDLTQPTYPIELLGDWAQQSIMVTSTYSDGTTETTTTSVNGTERLVILANGVATSYTLNSAAQWIENYRGYWAYAPDSKKLLIRTSDTDIIYTVKQATSIGLILTTSDNYGSVTITPAPSPSDDDDEPLLTSTLTTLSFTRF